MKRYFASFSCFLLFSAFALCQISTSLSSDPNDTHGTMTFGAPFFHGSAIAGAPYSAEEVDESVQTLADGTHIRQTIPGKKTYRDSLGRTRTEQQPIHSPAGSRPNAPLSPTVVEIIDPVAHARYVFDLNEPIAHRQELPADESRRASSRAQIQSTIGDSANYTTALSKSGLGNTPTAAKCPDGPLPAKSRHEEGPQTTMEDLGTQIIEGVTAEGKRHTTTWPVDSFGNDRPITTISESWTSADLKEIILSKSDDPRSGEHTHKLFNIDRSEPDPSLFEPPPGYTVKNETGEFTIRWNTAR
jgi:hypothetical protein